MASKCCSKCARLFLLSFFLTGPFHLKSKSFSICIICRAVDHSNRKKRNVFQLFDFNILFKKFIFIYIKFTEIFPIPFSYIRRFEIYLEFSIKFFFYPNNFFNYFFNFFQFYFLYYFLYRLRAFCRSINKN
jgi:hypothetical protein